MKNLVVFSLWGNEKIYWTGALKNIELVKKYYPGFISRFYIDRNCEDYLIKSIEGDGVEVILMDSKRINFQNSSERFNHSGLFWRFLALSDIDANVVLSRDCDSRISERESSAVNQWLQSDKDFHIMRDHPYHTVPILAGMWGCRNGLLRNIEEIVKYWEKFQPKGRFQAEDQDFLGQIIYPYIKNESYEHSDFNIKFNNEVFKFPTTRIDYEFIGDVFDENNIRHPDYWKILTKL